MYAVSASGIAGVPSNVISYSVFYNNPIGAPPAPLLPANGSSLTLPITLAWTDVANPQPSGYELQIAKDAGFTQIEEDAPQLTNASRTELSLTPGQKFWRVRSAQGDASPTTAAVTAFSAAGTFTVNPAPPAPVSIVPLSNPLYSGNTTVCADTAYQRSSGERRGDQPDQLKSGGGAGARNRQHARQHRVDAVPDAGRAGNFAHAGNAHGNAQLAIGVSATHGAAAID